MIRYLNCFNKKPDMAAEDFRDFWNEAAFDQLIREVVTLTGATRYTKHLVLHVEMGERLLRDRSMSEAFDGIIEYYWDSAAGLAALYDTEEGQELSRRLNKYQNQFIDLSRSTAFFTNYE